MPQLQFSTTVISKPVSKKILYFPPPTFPSSRPTHLLYSQCPTVSRGLNPNKIGNMTGRKCQRKAVGGKQIRERSHMSFSSEGLIWIVQINPAIIIIESSHLPQLIRIATKYTLISPQLPVTSRRLKNQQDRQHDEDKESEVNSWEEMNKRKESRVF